MPQLLNGNEVIAPNKADSALAKETSQKLAAHLAKVGGLRLELRTGAASEEVVFPSSLLRVLVRLLNEMAQGNAVTLTPLSPSPAPSSICAWEL